MGWKQWSAVAAVIGGGILLQMPARDEAEVDHGGLGHSGEMPSDIAATQGSFRTVVLEVTGMT